MIWLIGASTLAGPVVEVPFTWSPCPMGPMGIPVVGVCERSASGGLKAHVVANVGTASPEHDPCATIGGREITVRLLPFVDQASSRSARARRGSRR